MVDIIDIAIAKKLSTQGQVETLAAQAREAVANANAVVENIETITQQTQENNALAAESAEIAQTALEKANEASDKADEVIENIDLIVNVEAVDNEIKKLAIELYNSNSNNYNGYGIATTYPDNTITRDLNPLIKFYTSIGENTDGSMTQAAIKEYVEGVKSNLEEQISSGSSTINFNKDDAGKIIVIGSDGSVISGTITEKEILDALIKSDSYDIEGALGLEIDYENKLFTRVQDAASYSMGNDFSAYSMYGGRIRCNVADNGTILAFYGDANYKEDGTNGQVMVYQPKFYYARVPAKLSSIKFGKAIRKETVVVSAVEKPGFKLHPAFINENNEEVDYILLSAYNGSVYDTSEFVYDLNDTIDIDFNTDKLSSISGAKPASGVKNQLTAYTAEQLAKNRGAGWHITSMAAQSAEQMLELVEFGTLNGQNAIEAGVTGIAGNTVNNCSSLTGSAPINGIAQSTINEINGRTTEYTTAGGRAISYRGVENPWGNIWNFIGDSMISGNGNTEGGIPYICKNFNYSDSITSDYESIGFCIPGEHNWISAMGYGNEKYDWVFMPAETSGGNSAVPVGDSLWAVANLNTVNAILVGGYWNSGAEGGPFYYGCDKEVSRTSRNFGARLIFIPEKNSIYEANLNTWTRKFGG